MSRITFFWNIITFFWWISLLFRAEVTFFRYRGPILEKLTRGGVWLKKKVGKLNSRTGVRESTIWEGRKLEIPPIWLEDPVGEEIIKKK